MNRSTLDRYLLREVASSWLAVIFVLLMMMLATRFATLLSDTAKGEIPRDLLLKTVLLSALQYLVILIPVSQLLAIMLSMGRLYKDNEIAAMMGCGVSLMRLYRPFFLLGASLSVGAAALSFQTGPWAGRALDFLVKDGNRVVQYSPFEAGRFREIAGGRAVFYAAEVTDQQRKLNTVFGQFDDDNGSSVLIANEGEQRTDPTTGDREITLYGGMRYAGEPGSAAWDVVRFDELHTRVTPPEFIYTSTKRAIADTAELMASDAPEDRAELHWRLAAPITVLILTLLAVPLAYIEPRQGRYAKIVLGIVVYLVYTNLIGLGQSWIAHDKVPAALGLWWVHGLGLLLAGYLFAKRQGLLR